MTASFHYPFRVLLLLASISAGPGSLPGEVTQTLIPASILAHREYLGTRPGRKRQAGKSGEDRENAQISRLF